MYKLFMVINPITFEKLYITDKLSMLENIIHKNNIDKYAIYFSEFESKEDVFVVQRLLVNKYNPIYNEHVNLSRGLKIEINKINWSRFVSAKYKLTDEEINMLDNILAFVDDITNKIINKRYVPLLFSDIEKYSIKSDYKITFDNMLYSLDVNPTLHSNSYLFTHRDLFYLLMNRYLIMADIIRLRRFNSETSSGRMYNKLMNKHKDLKCDFYKTTKDILNRILENNKKSFNVKSDILLDYDSTLNEHTDILSDYSIDKVFTITTIKSKSDKYEYNISINKDGYSIENVKEIICVLEDSICRNSTNYNIKYKYKCKDYECNRIWSDDELHTLLSNCDTMTLNQLCEVIPTRTKYGIYYKLRQLNIPIKKEQELSQEDMDLIIKYYPIEGINCKVRLSCNPSDGVIKAFCKKHRLKKSPITWTDEEVSLVTELYNKRFSIREITSEINKLECNRYRYKSESTVYRFIGTIKDNIK